MRGDRKEKRDRISSLVFLAVGRAVYQSSRPFVRSFHL
ncbi:hypothetical protein LL3_03446 [Bacillus amyloliquefaciens LL3]|nr:hypothetical protein LL3_03446 [Bacillus amyloliquefaciens LL3]